MEAERPQRPRNERTGGAGATGGPATWRAQRRRSDGVRRRGRGRGEGGRGLLGRGTRWRCFQLEPGSVPKGGRHPRALDTTRYACGLGGRGGNVGNFFGRVLLTRVPSSSLPFVPPPTFSFFTAFISPLFSKHAPRVGRGGYAQLFFSPPLFSPYARCGGPGTRHANLVVSFSLSS